MNGGFSFIEREKKIFTIANETVSMQCGCMHSFAVNDEDKKVYSTLSVLRERLSYENEKY